MDSTNPKTLADVLRAKGIIDDAPIGRKFDADKPRYGLMKPEAFEEIVKVLTYGAKKYSVDNWKHVDDMENRYFDAAQRHQWAVRRGELYDQESGYHHLAHAIASLMFILQVQIEQEQNVPF